MLCCVPCTVELKCVQEKLLHLNTLLVNGIYNVLGVHLNCCKLVSLLADKSFDIYFILEKTKDCSKCNQGTHSQML